MVWTGGDMVSEEVVDERKGKILMSFRDVMKLLRMRQARG